MTISTRSRARAATDDADDSAPNKRQKLEPQEEAPALPAVQSERDEALWFEDGSVVLAAGNKLFKVHAGVLRHHSTVFKELLSAPALAALQERLDGCPVLRTEDNGTSLAQLLRIIYDGGNSDWFNSKVRIDFRDLRAVAIIAAKYKVPEVLEEVRSRLRVFYPTDSLDSWRSVMFAEVDEQMTYGALTIRDQDSIAVVALCRLLEMPDILPIVLYECCSPISAVLLVRGVIYDDEVVRLTEEDTVLCLRARQSLIAETARMYRAFTVTPRAGCRSPQTCAAKLERLLARAVDQDVLSDPSPLNQWVLFATEECKSAGSEPCTLCAAALMDSLDNAAEDVWRKLGQIFGVAPWPPNSAGEQQEGGGGSGSNVARAS
ncbi:hypothetical protein PsYK624_060130 [Phanerochaete sordida]|uniref:BTB domain-containing protein n=1 Tax=Phanerochaete sordida TaxID=48140 RepID=A0A9P3G7U2_9APHY|nr:hypothetical protein PsYK624_060130 [Phanerochaete sordida]